MATDVTPEKYLEDLTPLLGQTGCIKSAHEVDKIIIRMQEPNLMLVPRVVLVDVVRATKAPSTLEKFMSSGGWVILNAWLENSMKKGEENFPFIVCLLEVLRKLPVTVEYLQKGNIGKLVKQLKKAENEATSTAASNLLKGWLSVVKKHQNPSQPSKEALVRQRRKQEEEKKAAALGPISASVKAKEKEAAAKAIAKPKVRKTKKKAEDGKGDEPAEKRAKPSDITKLGDKKEKLRSPTLPPPVESPIFMNALSSATVPKARATRRKSIPPTTSKGPKAAGVAVKTEGEDVPMDAAAAQAAPAAAGAGQEGAPRPEVEGGSQQNSPEAMDEVRTQPAAPVYCGGSVLVAPGQRNRKKKRVTWAPTESMRDVYYFEIEEGERVNMHAKNFLDIAKMEKEKEALALRAFRSEAVETIPWQLIPIIMDAPALVNSGCKSVEKARQERREQSTLAFLFLSKASLPDTPGEPEPELTDARLSAEPKLIPIIDESDLTGHGAGGVPAVPVDMSPPTQQSSPGLDSTQTQATVQNLLDKLKTKGVLSGEGASAAPLQGGMNPPVGPGAMMPNFAGQPVPNRPPGPGMGPMFDGNMPPPNHPQGMIPPGPHGMPPHPDGSYPPSHGMRPPFGPQDGPPPMSHGGGQTWGPPPMGPPGGPPPVSALLPTPGPPQGVQPGGYQDEFGGDRQDYHGGGGDLEYHGGGGGGGGGGEDYDSRMHGGGGRGRGGFRGRSRGRGRGTRDIPCRHYMSPRGCTMGDKCRFFHPPPGSLGDWGEGGSSNNSVFYDRGSHHSGPYRGGRGGQFHQGPPGNHPHGMPPTGPGQHLPHQDQFGPGQQQPHDQPMAPPGGPGHAMGHPEGQYPPGQAHDQPFQQQQPGSGQTDKYQPPISVAEQLSAANSASASFTSSQLPVTEQRQPQPVAEGTTAHVSPSSSIPEIVSGQEPGRTAAATLSVATTMSQPPARDSVHAHTTASADFSSAVDHTTTTSNTTTSSTHSVDSVSAANAAAASANSLPSHSATSVQPHEFPSHDAKQSVVGVHDSPAQSIATAESNSTGGETPKLGTSGAVAKNGDMASANMQAPVEGQSESAAPDTSS